MEYTGEIVQENARRNRQEFSERKIELTSYPPALFVQLDSICNQDCLFCSRPTAYRHFDLDEFRRNYEEALMPAFLRAERIHITGSGELLLLPRARENLAYFNRFKYADKMFATNGSSLTPKMVDSIIESENRYVIHVSLHATTPELHQTMTRSSTFAAVVDNLRYLRNVRKTVTNLTIKFVFVVTTQNLEELPAFIAFAAKYGADEVVVYYNFVYRLDQKNLSVYFAKKRVNEIFTIAQYEAKRRDMPLSLPHRFDERNYPADTVCGEAWSQTMINPDGAVITCDAAGDSRETLKGKKFMDVWNGEYYRRIRSLLAGGNQGCASHCLRANPASINDFRSHFISRGKSEDEIREYLR